ncbi:MAG: hypothetical protein IJ521_00785, partial [Schwartzia sp.]|nr:hypothetical protein [Schwartzia sp. (in: firmicutes)]
DSTLYGGKVQLVTATSVTGSPRDDGRLRITSASTTPDNTVKATKAIVDAQEVKILGGKVDITDGSVITETNSENKNDLAIWALPGVTAAGDGLAPDVSSASGDSSDYAVTLKDSIVTLNTSGEVDPGISLVGGKVSLDASKLALSGGNDNSISVYAVSGASDAGMTATETNLIELKNGSVIDSQGERIELAAGQISVDDSTIKAKNEQNVFLVANDSIGFQKLEELSTGTPYGTGTNGTIAISTKSTVPTGATIDGNKTTPEPEPEPEPEPTPEPEPEPTPTPEPAPAPSIPEDVQEAYSEGMSNMQAAISGATDQGERESATRSLVASVNQGTGNDRAKAAAISGMMVAILQDHSLTDSQKISLQVEVVNNFTPTKNAKAEADNTVTNAAQAASNAPTNRPATEAATQPGAASEESPVRIG